MQSLRYYQSEAIESIYSFFDNLQPNTEGNPVVALPTGTGKSLIIAGFTRRALQEYPQTNILMLTHVKELIEQNANKLVLHWPNAPLGIFSAGLKQRDLAHSIIFAGVQSFARSNHLMQRHFDLVIVDECHLVSPKDGTTYLKVLANLKAVNRYLRVIGLSATPYRMGQGMLTDEIEVAEGRTFRLFTDICYDMTSTEGWKRLIAEGYLCPLIAPPSKNQPNGERLVEVLPEDAKISITNGDFNTAQVQALVNKPDKNRNALRQVCELGYNRASWLIFAAGIEHAEDLAAMLNTEFGIPTVAIHSEKSDKENDEALKAWKCGDVRAAVNMGKLTTGVDHPPLDLIAVLRPTMSPVLWVQMLGRGTRPFNFNKLSPFEQELQLYKYYRGFVKKNCLVLDFARNTKRLGPVNNPKVPRKKGKGSGDAPVKICPICGTYCHAKSRFCENEGGCTYEFEFEIDIAKEASTEDPMSGDAPKTEYFDVITVTYNLHQSRKGTPPMVRVDYNCGFHRFSEWLGFEHGGYTLHRAHDWWRKHYPGSVEPPKTTREALAHMSLMKVPRRIYVWVNTQPQKVLNYEY